MPAKCNNLPVITLIHPCRVKNRCKKSQHPTITSLPVSTNSPSSIAKLVPLSSWGIIPRAVYPRRRREGHRCRMGQGPALMVRSHVKVICLRQDEAAEGEGRGSGLTLAMVVPRMTCPSPVFRMQARIVCSTALIPGEGGIDDKK